MAAHPPLPSEMPDAVMIPLLDVVASAGPGAENPMPFELARLPFPRVWLDRLGVPERYARFIDARGDSMEPTITEGSVCLVDTRVDRARRDGVYVLVDGNSVRIKRIAIGWQGALTLISDNERYPTDTLAAPDAEALRVEGRVVWAGGEI
ncbi:helix-turn-helix transcriptional regulator [Camelimonas fluminis]|uniref:Helix-turn-helix transcriptional regulator n=1 Tax=Camelimonas fluminis TaxID=1576911 RepID=A0ABV7UBP4_9HYPH|nr:helix-turn-helix transcriptional regulator [Camelimonas fluminis]